MVILLARGEMARSQLLVGDRPAQALCKVHVHKSVPTFPVGNRPQFADGAPPDETILAQRLHEPF